MSITAITNLHAAPGQDDDLARLLASGRDRMRDAEGCESFDLLRDEDDPCAMTFLQRWVSHAAHDAAFSERIVQSGHLAKVLAVIDKPILQHSYQVAP
jgi:quinol monooxygenase YgiN